MSNRITTNVTEKELRTTKFPPEYNVKVDMSKVKLPVIKNWVAEQTTRILGREDDILIMTISEYLDKDRFPNPKAIQLDLMGFLEKDTAKFCLQLWKLCISAQNNPNGVPQELLDAAKEKLLKEKDDEEKAHAAALARADQEREHDRRIDDMRQQDRSSRQQRDGFGRDSFGRDSRADDRREYRRGSGDRGRGRYVPPSSRRTRSRSTSPLAKDRRANHASPDNRRGHRRYSRSRSRTPPRRRRERSRSRSPPRRRYSRSPRRYRRRSPSSSRSRSPPRRRRERSRSRTPEQRKDERRELLSGSKHSDRTKRETGRLSRSNSASDH